jgi:hypothetical protein
MGVVNQLWYLWMLMILDVAWYYDERERSMMDHPRPLYPDRSDEG